MKFDGSSMSWPDDSSPVWRRPSSSGHLRLVTPRWAGAAMQGVLDASTAGPEPELPTNTRFGDYELLEALGSGASGTVYRAYEMSLGRVVALKLMNGRGYKHEAELQRFRLGAQAAADLDHPNIAKIYRGGTCQGVPFVSMRLLEGGTLADACTRVRQSQVGAARLMAKVARAVHYAHQRGVLHRDLKPANIVLDEKDEPFVVDFGFAKYLDERALSSKPSLIVGTLGYMAPEQAGTSSRSLTFSADIFGLGAILYELLTGQVPFQAPSVGQMLRVLTSAEPALSPRAIDPGVDRDLERVCLKCLEKDPQHRYTTALELAHDLERWLEGKPISIPPEGAAGRVWRWCRTHPALATIIVGAALVLAGTGAVAASVARDYEQQRLSDILSSNTYAAQSKAGEVLAQLRALSNPLARCASDVRIAALLTPTGPLQQLAVQADRLLVECGAKTGFDSVAVVSRSGDEVARLPRGLGDPSVDQVVRKDYFQGAVELAKSGYRSIHVGKVVRSDEDGRRYISLSAPVFDADNRWLGLVHATVLMDAFLESIRLLDNGLQVAVLAGVEEREPDQAQGSDDGVMVLLHDRLGGARAASNQGPWLKKELNLRRHDAGRAPFRVSEPDHAQASEPTPSLEDNPEAHSLTIFGKRWLVGYAPVGHTGYAVVVQTHYDDALGKVRRVLRNLMGWSTAMLVLGASLVVVLARTLEERARAQRS